MRLWQERKGLAERPVQTKASPPPGFRFESSSDWGVPLYDEARAAQRRREVLAKHGVTRDG